MHTHSNIHILTLSFSPALSPSLPPFLPPPCGSKVISAFCETSESAFGKIALGQLYRIADKDGNGVIDKQELKSALTALGFTHLSDAAIDGIFARADADGNAEIDFEEFMQEAPKTLRTNLIKLAKTNGNDLGFLS